MKEKILSDVESATSGNYDSVEETESTSLRRRYAFSLHTYEPVREKTNNLCFRQGQTQTDLHEHRRWLEV